METGAAGSLSRRSALFVLSAAAAAQAQESAPVVVLFGDSLFSGFGLPRGQDLSHRLAEELALRGSPANVRNAGRQGDTSPTALGRVRSLGRAIDLALILIGANDRRAGLPQSVTRSAMRDIVRVFRNLGAETVMVGDGRDTPGTADLDGLRSDLAEQEQVSFLPGALAGFFPGSGLTLPDGVHPNADGVMIMAERLAGPVHGALRGRQG